MRNRFIKAMLALFVVVSVAALYPARADAYTPPQQKKSCIIVIQAKEDSPAWTFQQVAYHMHHQTKVNACDASSVLQTYSQWIDITGSGRDHNCGTPGSNIRGFRMNGGNLGGWNPGIWAPDCVEGDYHYQKNWTPSGVVLDGTNDNVIGADWAVDIAFGSDPTGSVPAITVREP